MTIENNEEYNDVKSAVIRRNTARCMSALEAANEPKVVRDMVKNHFRACWENSVAFNATSLDAMDELGASEYAKEQFRYCKELMIEDLNDWENYYNRYNQ